jgi:hypothetical protein
MRMGYIMIFTLDARGNVLLPAMKEAFEMDETTIFREINIEFKSFVNILLQKGVDYKKLKRALIPNQDKDKYEICLVFDTSRIKENGYGYSVFEKIIPLLDKESTYSILTGDYIDISEPQSSENQLFLHKRLYEKLQEVNSSHYMHSSQYFLVYINSITKHQSASVVTGLEGYPWFTGFLDMTYQSVLKSYLSMILSYLCVKTSDIIIVQHESDRSDMENVNVLGYPFETNGFKLFSVNENLFGLFLSYKIESISSDKEDVSFSLNAICPKFNSLDKLMLNINEGKVQYLKNSQKGKGGILRTVGLGDISGEELAKLIFQKIRDCYIYNLEYNTEHDVIEFNVCIELPTIEHRLRKTTVALKYIPENGEIHLLTIT